MSSGDGDGSGVSSLHTVNRDYITSKKNNYISKSPTFSGDSREFEWWKSQMYTHNIGIDDKLQNILEDDIYI